MEPRRYLWVANGLLRAALGLLVLMAWLSVQLTLAYRRAPTPQAILVLEGQTSRVRFAAQFSRQHPSLPLWVSGNPGASSQRIDFSAGGGALGPCTVR